jgi:subtilisin family serine protease
VIVLLKDKGTHKAVADSLGLRFARAADFEGSAVRMDEVPASDGLVFDEIGVAVMTLAPDQHNKLQAMSAEAGGDVLASEPERVMYALDSSEYWRGYRDGVNSTIDRLLGQGEAPGQQAAVEQATDESRNTWGLQVTRVVNSKFSGKGIRVAVLDTGLDLTHPDFSGRAITTQSFISGAAVQDGNGHGTHCIGTSCGPAVPGMLPRYGIASGALIFAGKVLSDQGSGADAGILAGINWAVANKCSVSSMSLGAPVQQGEAFSPVYEGVAQRALAANTLIIAAAGNDSRRPTDIRPVGRPANCPSIMAVGAVDVNMQIAFFSNRSINPNGGSVDIVGPGVDVRSSWPMPRRYNTISGTSMATPHVAGIAALWLESQKLTAPLLWAKLTQSAKRLRLASVDVGSGLVQAP